MRFATKRSVEKEIRSRLVQSRTLILGCALLTLCGASQPDSKVGVLYGQVVDATSGKPVAGATVALQDPAHKVIAWTRTDDQGRYTLVANPLNVLHLKPSRHHGLLTQLVHGVGEVVTLPVRAVGTAAKVAAGVVKQTVVTNPGGTIGSVVSSAATGSPVPAIGQIANNTLKSTEQSAATQARQGAAQSLTDPHRGSRKPPPTPEGQVSLVVTASQFKDLSGAVAAYWLAAPGEVSGQSVGPQAWLPTVKLAPASSDKKSELAPDAVQLSDGSADPHLAPPGSKVHVSVKLQAPVGLATQIRVFAREAHTHVVAELKPQKDGVYAGDLALDPKSAPGDSAITIAAFHAEPVEVSVKHVEGDPIMDLCSRAEDMDPGKPYDYDPRIFASQNRVDLPLTILDPKAASPPTPPKSTAPPAPGQPQQGQPAPPPKK